MSIAYTSNLSRYLGKGLAAQVKRANEIEGPPLSAPTRAHRLKKRDEIIAKAQEKKQWASGETLTVKHCAVKGKPAKLYIKNTGGRLELFLMVKKADGYAWTSQGLLIALNKGGWVFNCPDVTYLDWSAKTYRRLVNGRLA